MASENKIAQELAPAVDTLLHEKIGDNQSQIVFPVTRYANIIGAPCIVDDLNDVGGRAFSLYSPGGDYEMTSEILSKLTSIGV